MIDTLHPIANMLRKVGARSRVGLVLCAVARIAQSR
jgi:hypothetical protein